MLSVTISYCNAERHYAHCHYAEWHYAECCGTNLFPQNTYLFVVEKTENSNTQINLIIGTELFNCCFNLSAK